MTEMMDKTSELAANPISEVRPAASIDPLIDYLRSLAEGKALDAHIRSKLALNRLSFAYPATENVTCLAHLRDGIAVGLSSGKFMRVLPPACELIEIAQTSISGLASGGGIFILIATESTLFGWNNAEKKVRSKTDVGKTVSCVECNTAKDVVAVGCTDGFLILFKVTAYEACELQRTFDLPPASSPSSVLSIKTTDSTTWLATCSSSKSITIWDHEDYVLLYYFSFTGTSVFPTIFPQGQKIILPESLWMWENWLVTRDVILLPSLVIIKLTGNVVSNCYKLTRGYDEMDSKWETIANQCKKGHFTFVTDSFIISLTKPGEGKTQEALKKWPLIEIDLEIPYNSWILSGFRTYIGFACERSLELVTVSGMESKFAHTLTNLFRYRNSTGYVHWRFQQMFVNSGTKSLFRHNYTLFMPFVSKRGTFGLVRYPKKLNMIEIVRTLDGKTGKIETENEIIMHSFSKDDTLFLAITKNLALVYHLESLSVYYSIPGEYSKTTIIRFTESGALFLFSTNIATISLGPDNTQRCNWPYDRSAWLWKNDELFLGYTKTKTELCRWTGFNMNPIASASIGFEILKVFNSGSMCAGFNVSGVTVMSLPKLEQLIHIDNGYVLMVDRDGPLFCTYSFERSASDYGHIRVWDLALGIPVWKIDMGLKAVLVAANDERITNTFVGWTKLRIDYQKPAILRLYRTWMFDITTLTNGRSDALDPAAVSIYEESFERYCVLMKLLSDLALSGKYDQSLARLILMPFRVTAVHLLVYRNQPTVLSQALKQGAAVVRSAFGSPVRLCIERNSMKCLDSILHALIDLNESHHSDLLTTLFHLSDDIADLILFQSSALPDFLRILMQPKPEETIVSLDNALSVALPCSLSASALWIEKFSTSPLAMRTHEAVEYLVCPVPVHCEIGTVESLKFLKLLVFDVTEMEILNNEFIKTLVDMKWNKIWPYVLLVTLLYWGFLGLVLMRLFDYGETHTVDTVFIAFNCYFLASEIFQAISSLRQYFKSRWNYVDLARCGFCYGWVFTANPPIWLTFITVLLCVIRGLTTFQTFAPTRFFVRMIYACCSKTVSFIFILIYSTLAFGLLFAAADPAAVQTFTQSWSLSSQLDMGGFDMSDAGGLVWAVFLAACLVNVVWLLNLLISILGSAYEEFKPEAEGADVLAKADLVYQYENAMLCRRVTHVPSQFIQTCTRESSKRNDQSLAAKVAQLASQMAQLEDRMPTIADFRRLEKSIDGRLLEMRTMMKQQMAAGSGAKQGGESCRTMQLFDISKDLETYKQVDTQ